MSCRVDLYWTKVAGEAGVAARSAAVRPAGEREVDQLPQRRAPCTNEIGPDLSFLRAGSVPS